MLKIKVLELGVAGHVHFTIGVGAVIKQFIFTRTTGASLVLWNIVDGDLNVAAYDDNDDYVICRYYVYESYCPAAFVPIPNYKMKNNIITVYTSQGGHCLIYYEI